MKNIKKFLLFLLVMLCILNLSGCNNSNNNAKPSTSDNIYQSNDSDDLYVILHLNMPLLPEDSIEMFEDPLNEVLKKYKIGEVTGGGTELNDGMPVSNDVELSIKKEKKEDFINYIKSLNIYSKGSYIEFDDEKIEIGTLEGLNLRLNGIDLDSSIYKNNDVNHVIDEIVKQLNGKGTFYSHYVGEKYTNLYFYGESYDEMKEIIDKYIISCPLCKKSIVEKL